ncbi:hypothetical protein Tco_0104047 [Tanacetum coccineum]
MYRVVKKLKFLKKPLRLLLYNQGNLHERFKFLRNELDEVQRALDSDPSNVVLREEEVCYLHSFNDTIINEERFLKQKAKVEWLRVDDSNTAYFHKVVKGRASRARFDAIMDSNGLISDGSVVPSAFASHYMHFLGATGDSSALNVNDLFLNKLSDVQASNVVREVYLLNEIKHSKFPFSTGDDKSPGPDGFTSTFFKNTWDISSSDVVNAVKEFFVNDILLKELNHTIITLIPKVSTLVQINDFCPISCCNVLFKCISKIISNSIKECLDGLVSITQSTFVSGRRISNNILLTQVVLLKLTSKRLMTRLFRLS